MTSVFISTAEAHGPDHRQEGYFAVYVPARGLPYVALRGNAWLKFTWHSLLQTVWLGISPVFNTKWE